MSKSKSRGHHPVVMLMDELVRLKTRFQSVFEGASSTMGVSHMELMVLTAVVESQTPPTVPQIGRSLGHPRQVVQRAANSLIAAKLLEPAANPDHKRAQLLHATSTGKELYEAAAAISRQAANSVGRMIDLEKCERLAKDLHELRATIEAHLRSRKLKTVREMRRR
jgi:DNA-binding MarR family transcriptional regulator